MIINVARTHAHDPSPVSELCALAASAHTHTHTFARRRHCVFASVWECVWNNIIVIVLHYYFYPSRNRRATTMYDDCVHGVLMLFVLTKPRGYYCDASPVVKHNNNNCLTHDIIMRCYFKFRMRADNMAYVHSAAAVLIILYTYECILYSDRRSTTHGVNTTWRLWIDSAWVMI